ncbi:hypothetical protein DL95DRAFT_470953 [Leptodontidium sp. 2 PMI_412]|nr:hypothetical protein DL95DRAFT_470953 [Leptodontidium sp. 2 PMI_412]
MTANTNTSSVYTATDATPFCLSLGAVGEERKIQEDGAEEVEGKDIRGWLESVGLDDHDHEGEGEVLESVERDGYEGGDGEGDVNMDTDMQDGEVVEGLFEEAGMRGVGLNGVDAADTGVGEGKDGDGKRVESLEKEKRERMEEKERKRREEVLEGMAGGGF